jgi:uncharacterized glyoxalase superfamily protein PhnB
MPKIYPVLKYNDAQVAFGFMEGVLGCERLQVHEGENGGIAHAELRFGDGVLMFSTAGEGDPTFNQGIGRTVVYVVVDDVDPLFERARKAGAEVLMEPTDQDYGSRDFAIRDPEGNIWSFGTYAPTPDA